MRLKLLALMMLFVIAILAGSSITLYITFKKALVENAEIRLDHWVDNIIIEIAKNPILFKENPEEFLFSASKNEIISSGILVQFMDTSGKLLARSPGLKSNTLPFELNDSSVIKDIEFDDGTHLNTFQSSILVNRRLLGYVVVGISTTQMHQNFNKLRNILLAVMICTVVALGIGLNTLVSLNIMKNQRLFLSFASHELRTPLSIISGHAEIALRDPALTDTLKDTLQTIQTEAVWMSKMVNNLLLIFRGKTGAELLQIELVELGDLIMDVSTALKVRYPLVTISITLSPHSQMMGDTEKLKQMINNVMENAAKYTNGKGKIDLTLEDFPSQLVLTVADNGPGIPASLHKRIFDPFYRISQHHQGIGIGLALVKWVAEMHRGKIKITQSSHLGTTFCITLPKTV
jgi:signal transduction histidine kinase